MNARTLAACVAACVLLFVPRTAGAEEPARAARQHYDAGVRRYNLGEFAAAADEFRAAYRLAPTPALVFDMAQAYRAARDYAEARRDYALYLTLAPAAPERAYIAARLDEMAAKEAEPASRAPVALSFSAPDRPTTADRGRDRAPRVAGLVTAGAGVALLGTSVWFALSAASDANQLNQIFRQGLPWDERASRLYDDGRRAETTAIVTAAVGGALVIGGGVYAWLHRAPPRIHGGELAVVPRARGVAIAMAWRF